MPEMSTNFWGLKSGSCDSRCDQSQLMSMRDSIIARMKGSILNCDLSASHCAAIMLWM